jgi:hypothetical protein
VRLAVADVDLPIPSDEDTVWPVEPTPERVAVRSIAALAGSGDSRDHARLQVDSPDGMVFGVGNVERSVWCQRDPFRPIQGCCDRRTAIAGVPFVT